MNVIPWIISQGGQSLSSLAVALPITSPPWHAYSHLHGMSAPGLNLKIALEPDALHRETQRRLSTGASANQPLVLERGYTNLGQLDHLTLRGANSAASEQQYQYDALGRMSFRSIEGDQASKVIAYSFDAAGRLIGSQHGDQAHRYSVDAAGNRLEGQQALSDNRLGQLNGTRYRYDGAGNLIERQQPNGECLTLGYDAVNRLVHHTHASELGATREATYRYDGLGRRISKTVRHATATTHYGWDGDRIVQEETENQRTTVVYEPGSFVPMLRIDDTQQGQVLSAYITDALGTPMQLVTPNGQPRWLAEPDDWAAVKNQRAVRNVTQPIRFQGQWHDEESGLYYNRHRYYDPMQSSGNPVRHDFLMAGEDIYSFQAGEDSGWLNMIWSDGWTDKENESPNALCTVISEDPEYADAVRHAAENVVGLKRKYNIAAYPGTLPHALGARNCQTWANDVLREADRATSNGSSIPCQDINSCRSL